ncbi:MAG: D-isomer specific 2-hydroxyacid dehydrogenase family protein [Terrimesophilobacter sp.]
MSAARIVFADGDPLAGDLLAGGLTSRLETLGGFEFHPAAPPTTAEYIARLESAEGILLGWHLPAEVMVEAKKLKVIAFTGTGAVNFVDMAQARKRGVTVTNTPGYANQAVAEHALALTLGVVKQLGTDRDIRSGKWGAEKASREFGEITLGIVGMGGIGRRFAELASALGFSVLSWTRSGTNAAESSPGVTAVSLDELLKRSDVVSLHLGLNDQTRGFFDKSRFDQLRDGAVLINTARAELLDSAAFLHALDSGRLGGAGLDVFHTEPLPATDPLLARPNVIVTPHIGSFTEGATRWVLEIAVANLEAFFCGAPTNVVTH